MVEQKDVRPAGAPMDIAVTIMGKGVVCKGGSMGPEVPAYAMGLEAYGATETQCAQMCAPQAGLQWMAGVKEGTCADQGYTEMVEQKDVRPAGAPMDISVTIMASKGVQTAAGNSGGGEGDEATSNVPPADKTNFEGLWSEADRTVVEREMPIDI